MRTCACCGRSFLPQRATRLYCSANCGKEFRKYGHRVARSCSICGGPIKGGRRDRTVCSNTCRNRRLVKDRTKKAERQRRYRANRKARGLAANTWTPALRDAYHRRRTLKSGGTLGKAHFTEIAERDHWTCRLCSDPVDPGRIWPDPLSGSIDHIVPLSLGGGHEPTNVQLAHLRCNTAKGARLTA